MTVKELDWHRREDIQPAGNAGWTGLYKLGGLAALTTLVFFPVQIIVFLLNPPPASVAGWFELFKESPLVGLLDLDLLLMVDQILMMLVFLSLYIALRRSDESLMVVGLVFGLLSNALFIASNPAFDMLALANQYYAAGSASQRDMLLAAGQSAITAWQGSAFHFSYILGSIAPVLISMVMLRGRLFSRATAYLGIVANVTALGLYIPVIGIYISIFSVLFLWAWLFLTGRRLLFLGRNAWMVTPVE